jgi:hypothetical protein
MILRGIFRLKRGELRRAGENCVRRSFTFVILTEY